MARLILFLFVFLPAVSFSQLNIAYYIGSGRYDLYKENYASAVSRFTAVINSKPRLAEAWFLRGIAKYNLSDYIGAQADFSAAIDINPFYADAFHYRGLTNEQLGNFSKAKEDLQAAIELNPTNGKLQSDMGTIYLMHEQYANALEYFNEALKIDKTLPDTYFNRAVSHIQLGDTLTAIKDLNAGLRLNPFSAEAFRKLAIIQYEQKEYKEALISLNQALKLDEDNTMILFQRAITYYQMQEYEPALEDLQRILEFDSSNALVYYNRAILFTEMGRYNDAINDYTEAININPDNILVYYNRAGVRIELNDYTGALNDYNRAIAIFPDFATAYLNRSYVKHSLHDYGGSYLDKKKAEELISKYKENSGDSSEFSQLRDTAYNLKQVLDFDSEFSNSFTRSRLQNQAVTIKLQQQYLVQAAQVPPAEDLPFINALFEYNRVNNQKIDLYPRLITKELSAIQLDNIDSINYMELSIIQKTLAETLNANYNTALDILRKSKSSFSTKWLYYFIEGTIEGLMTEYIFSMTEIPTTIKLTEGSTTHSIQGTDNRTSIDFSDAEKSLEISKELNPQFSLTWYNSANILVKEQRFREAIDDYSKAISIDDNLAQAYYNRGLTLIYLQEVERGCLDISKAGQLGITDSYAVIKRYCEKTKKE